MPHIICVGAVYMDTILSVPHFPQEDTKLRATSLVRRRGGNTANTLEVLSQLLDSRQPSSRGPTTTTLSLLTVLPDQTAPDSRAVVASLPRVDPALFLHRAGHHLAASSYVIQSAASLSRTIVSANPLAEMSVSEFQAAVAPLLDAHADAGAAAAAAAAAADGDEEEALWFHFEGRIPDTLLACVAWLRDRHGFGGRVRISVECEKPEREGMRAVAALADVVFYSRLWAEAHADTTTAAHLTPSAFLASQLPLTHPAATLICTWGAAGASALQKRDPAGSASLAVSTPGWRHPDPARQPVDSVGAGDTFIAGMLFALVERGAWGLQRALGFASEVAGRKVYREGFGGLGRDMENAIAGEGGK